MMTYLFCKYFTVTAFHPSYSPLQLLTLKFVHYKKEKQFVKSYHIYNTNKYNSNRREEHSKEELTLFLPGWYWNS